MTPKSKVINTNQDDEVSTPIEVHKVNWFNALFGKEPEFKRSKQNSR